MSIFQLNKKSLLVGTGLALIINIAFAGSTQITVRDGQQNLRIYDVITDSNGNYIGMFGVCDGAAGAQCASVMPSNTQPASANPSLVTSTADGNNVTQGAKTDSAYGGSGGASIVAVLKGLYNSATASIPAGTNNIGAVSSALGTVGGWTPLIANGLSNSPLPIKASPGQLGMLQCYNPNQAQAYIQIFNLTAASVSIGTSTPTLSIPIAPTATGGWALSNPGMQFNTAISIAATTTALGATAPSTAVDCNTAFN